MIGMRFGKLSVLARSDRGGSRPYWLCRCDCGNETSVRGDHLRTGRIVSCSCHRIALSRRTGRITARRRYSSRNEYLSVWRQENRGKVRRQLSDWKKRHSDRVTADTVKRQARTRRAMPGWADRDAIAAVYALSKRLTEETGIRHHVDHVVPIAGATVCGLHVAWNLRAIPAVLNVAKGNKHDARLWAAPGAGLEVV